VQPDLSYVSLLSLWCAFILVCELSKENQTAKWEIDADDGDTDFLHHTLFLKQVNNIGFEP